METSSFEAHMGTLRIKFKSRQSSGVGPGDESLPWENLRGEAKSGKKDQTSYQSRKEIECD